MRRISESGLELRDIFFPNNFSKLSGFEGIGGVDSDAKSSRTTNLGGLGRDNTGSSQAACEAVYLVSLSEGGLDDIGI